MNDDELPNVEPGQFSSPPDQKFSGASPCLGWGFMLGGGLVLLIGCVIAFGATAIQFERLGDWGGFIAFMIFCPAPLIVLGILPMVAGLLALAQKRQIEDRTNS